MSFERTSPPWLQHRDLKLCHDQTHHLLQTCLIHNSAPHPTNAQFHRSRDTFSTWVGTHRIRLLNSILRVSLSARNSGSLPAAPADLTTPVFQFVSVESFTSTHFTSPFSLVRFSLRGACDRASRARIETSYQLSSPPATQSKKLTTTREYGKCCLGFSFVLATCRKNCATVPHKLSVFDITSC